MTALPGDFAFNEMKATAAPARGYTSLIPPEAGISFTQGQIITINLPAGAPGEYLRASECEFRFKVTNTGATPAAGAAANDCYFSGGAFACIEKIEVYHGSTLLSSQDDYGTLHSVMYDTTVSSNYRQGIGALLQGTNNCDLGSSTEATIKGATIAQNGGVYTAAIQLINPLVGTLAERALPIGLMSADLSIRITLASNAKAFVSTGAPVITYSDVNFAAVIVQLDPSIDQAIASDNNGVLAFHASDFRMYQHSLSNASTFDIVQLPIRFSSCRYTLHLFRRAANLTDLGKESVAGREKATLTRYQYRHGSQMVPQRPIELSGGNVSQVVVELLRMMGRYESYGDDQGVVFTDTTLFTRDSVAANNEQGTFIFGADITAFGGTRDSLVNSGLNLLSVPCALEMSFTAIPHDVRMTTFASFDTLYSLQLDTGLLSVRF